MPKHHQLLSPYQQGIVRRFFAHRDGVLRQRLAELVSELFLAEGDKAREKLWKSARDTMTRAGADAKDIEAVCGTRDVQALARIVTELQSAPSGGRGGDAPRRRPAEADDDF
jgi:hypothetical protein